MTITISDETIKKISSKIGSRIEETDDESEKVFFELLKDGGQAFIKYVNADDLTNEEAKGALATAMAFSLFGAAMYEEIGEEYPSAYEEMDKLLDLE